MKTPASALIAALLTAGSAWAGEDVVLALDAASSEFHDNGKYVLGGEGKTLDSEGMAG